MRGSRLTLTGSLVAVIGLALLVFEATRAISGEHILSATAQLLMWVGLGATAVGGLLLVIGGWSAAGTLGPTEDD